MLNDSDQPLPLKFHIRRRLFDVLWRRAQRFNEPVETEASRVLEAALLAIQRAERVGATSERFFFTKIEVDGMMSGLRRTERARYERQLSNELAKLAR